MTYADVPARQIKMLGSLPVIASFCRRLDISGVTDELVPIRPVASLTVGQAAEAMICNRLTSPAPLVHVQDWARDLGGPGGPRHPRARAERRQAGPHARRDRPAPGKITGAVAVRAIGAFGIDISQLHWDMTSFSLYGAYEQPDEDYPAPAYGHPKDRRTDLLQIQAGIAAAGDGGSRSTPRLQRRGRRGLPGDRGDDRPEEDRRGEEVPAGRRLQADQLRQRRRDRRCPLHVPGPRVQDLRQGRRAGRLRPGHRPPRSAMSPDATSTRSHTGQRAAGTSWKTAAVSDPQPQAQKRPADPAAPHLRALHRPRRRRRDQPRQETRPRPRRPGPPGPRPGRPLLPRRKVTARLQQIAATARPAPTCATPSAPPPPRPAAPSQRPDGRHPDGRHRPDRTQPADTRPGTGSGGPGKPTLTWWFDQAAIDAEAATDGWYALLTNLDASITAAEVLLRYKARKPSNAATATSKDPSPSPPMFLNNNRRIAALITVISLALLIFCLIEREARRNLAPAGQTRRPVQPAARPAYRPAHPHRPGRHAADPGHRDQPGADPQAQPGPGPAAGTTRRRPDPPAVT